MNITEKIEKLISEMTLDEKLGQLTQEFVSNDRIDELEELAKRGLLGSCILASTPFAGNAEQENIFIASLNKIQKAAVENSRLGIPVINGRDIIHGSKTIFPIPLAQAATWDFELIKEAASIMSREASFDGVHWTFAPMLDICCDPRWGRIIECPGEDPLLGKMFAKASVEGIQGDDMAKEGKLAACAKHYIGYGASQGGRDKNPTEWSDYTLRNKALPAFKEAIKAGVATVMSAFNEISGQPATSSRYHLTDILRGELGFDGFVVSDWAAIERLTFQGVSDNDELSATLAINAGVDMDMVDGIYKNNLKSALEKGSVTMATIDEAVRRILGIKFRLGLFENPYIKEENTNDMIMTPEYLDKAKELSAHSMVLLKNSGVLPLSKGKKVIVAGPMATDKKNLLGSWHAGGREADVISLTDGINAVNGGENTAHYQPFSEYPVLDFSDTCIIALGESRDITGEGRTMPDIELPDPQLEQIKELKSLGKKVVAVVFAGRPLALSEMLPYCDAVLWAWHGGTMCGLAAAEILFGDFNPCGKLPVTFPRSTGQIPIFYNHNRNEACDSGYYSHRSYLSTNMLSTPAFVFGFGLSYTEFEYSNFKYNFNKTTNCVEVTFDIKNTGSFDGYEIAQCYVRDMVASMSRPVKELKAFDKVFLKAGETKNVCLFLSKDDLSFYNGKGEWIFESGDFRIEIGKSCKDICFETVQNINF